MGGDERSEREDRAIEECVQGRLEGLALLYEAYRLPVFRTCLRLLGDRAPAEDAAQEVFLRAFERIRTFDRRAAFSTWLYRVTVNYCLNALERDRLRTVLPVESVAEPIDPAGGPESAYRLAEDESGILRALDALSVEHRTLLVLREIEDLSYREMSAILDLPLGTVMSRLSRAREALRRIWREKPMEAWNGTARGEAGSQRAHKERT